MRIKTLGQEWLGQTLLSCRYTDGPTVEIEADDVSHVESVSSILCKDKDLKVYLYRKDGPTLCVAYTELLKLSEDLASKAKESMKRKANRPDPCGWNS